MTTVADVVAYLERRYPPAWAQSWDRVGLVLGEPAAEVASVLFAVDCVPETVAQAAQLGAGLLVTHHPLLLRGVSSVAPTTYQGRIVHDMITGGIALYTAHTNADVAAPGVSDALARLLGLTELVALHPVPGADPAGPAPGTGRVGRLADPVPLAQFAAYAARVLPATSSGVRVAGPPDRLVGTVAVCGGSGDAFLVDARAAGADAYLTADLRHHPASEYRAQGGPALLDAAHWATERPWLDVAAAELTAELGLATHVSDIDTDPWTMHQPSTRSEGAAP